MRVDFRGSPLEGSATSLEELCGAGQDRAQLLAHLLARLDHWLPRLGSADLFHAWRARLRLPATPVQVNGLHGVAEDVAPDGALLLRDAAGVLHPVLSGELLREHDGR